MKSSEILRAAALFVDGAVEDRLSVDVPKLLLELADGAELAEREEVLRDEATLSRIRKRHSFDCPSCHAPGREFRGDPSTGSRLVLACGKCGFEENV